MTRQRCRNPGEEQSLLCTAGKITVAPLYHDSEGGRNNTSLIFLMNPFHSRQGTGLQHTGGCSGDLLSCIRGHQTQQQDTAAAREHPPASSSPRIPAGREPKIHPMPSLPWQGHPHQPRLLPALPSLARGTARLQAVHYCSSHTDNLLTATVKG